MVEQKASVTQGRKAHAFLHHSPSHISYEESIWRDKKLLEDKFINKTALLICKYHVLTLHDF